MDTTMSIEAQHARANPDTWVQVGDIEDDGDIGGDIQAGTAWSKRFIRYISTTGEWAVINDAYFVAQREEPNDDGTYERWIENLVEYMLCADPDDPGGTELWANYEYPEVSDDRWPTDERAKQMASWLRADLYGDPKGWS